MPKILSFKHLVAPIAISAILFSSVAIGNESSENFAKEGMSAISAGKFQQSIELFDQALSVDGITDAERGNYLSGKGAAFLELGWQTRQEEPLRSAVKFLNDALKLQNKDADPVAWAQSQIKLGDASRSLAFGMYNKNDTEAGAKLYNDAIAAFEAALTVLTKEDNPVEWAQSQRALGQVYTNSDTYLAISGKQSNATRLTRAADAFEAAMEIYSQEAEPVNWAGLQFQLGDIYSSLHQRQGGNVWLSKSVEAHKNVLLVLNEADNPGVWSQVQYFIGNGLVELGAANKDIDQLKASIVASTLANESAYFKQAFPEAHERNVNNIAAAEALIKKYESE